VICQHCGVQFERPKTKGPFPKWCSIACRQRAYEARQLTKEYEAGYAEGFIKGYNRGRGER
jgi:hypothetical protein